ncbi:MAG: hypothetical protein WCV91_05105, partial [Candidatus Margulisiibacteriota bacterium]
EKQGGKQLWEGALPTREECISFGLYLRDEALGKAHPDDSSFERAKLGRVTLTPDSIAEHLRQSPSNLTVTAVSWPSICPENILPRFGAIQLFDVIPRGALGWQRQGEDGRFFQLGREPGDELSPLPVGECKVVGITSNGGYFRISTVDVGKNVRRAGVMNWDYSPASWYCTALTFTFRPLPTVKEIIINEPNKSSATPASVYLGPIWKPGHD